MKNKSASKLKNSLTERLDMKKGIFLDGSVSGIGYVCGKYQGCLDENGNFLYEEGQAITFSIGRLVLGSCMAKPVICTVDIVPETTSRLQAVTHYTVTNIARLLLSVKAFTPEKTTIIDKYRSQIQFSAEPLNFEKAMEEVLAELDVKLISVEKTHNIVRRCLKGIYKETDVKIPTRDGRYVLADVYRPLVPGKYPVVMSMGAFGKSFVNGFTLNEEDEAFFDLVEDRFYEAYGDIETKKLLQGAFFKRMGPCFGSALPIPNLEGEPVHPDGPPACLVPVSSAFEQATADDWVPYGYAVILVEEYGTGKNNDQEKQFSERNAKDYCDAIEWAADQEWSNGKVGLYGASYFAMTQYLAAQRHPKGLTAMIPIMGDYDSYRHYIYSGGGLFNRADNMDLSCPTQEYCFMHRAKEQPFWNEETYGPEGEYMSSADITKIDYPIWPVTEPDASLHGLGSSEAYINCSSENKKFTLLNSCGIHFWMYGEEYMNRHRAFFDHWLKGEENGIMDEPAVDIQIRTGNGSYYWRHETDWPVPGTEYRKLYLNVTEKSAEDTVSEDVPFENNTEVRGVLNFDVDCKGSIAEYNADVMRSETRRTSGATFVTAPFEEDVELAGYLKAGLYVSSSTDDMEVHVNVRVLDEEGQEIIYPAYTSMERGLPLAFGSLKVSHRELDHDQSRDYYPVHLHTKEASKKLMPDEIVFCEVGTFPTSGLIKKGWRLQLEIDPVSNRWIDFEEDYREGSVNRIHCGVGYPSYLQIPVLPKK